MKNLQRSFVLLFLGLVLALLPGCSGCSSRPAFQPRSFGADDEEVEKVNVEVAAAKPADESPIATPTTKPASDPEPKKEPPKTGAPQRLNEEQRFRKSAENMARISAAIQAYVKDHGKFPDSAMTNLRGERTMSWRVLLLPYLGHQELYDRFDFTQPFTSESNMELMSAIPDVYRDPEVTNNEGNTPYLLIAGHQTFFVTGKGKRVGEVREYLQNTVILAEASPQRCRGWTDPTDFGVDLIHSEEWFRLFNNRLLGAFGDGRIALVDFDPLHLRTVPGKPQNIDEMTHTLHKPTLDVAALFPNDKPATTTNASRREPGDTPAASGDAPPETAAGDSGTSASPAADERHPPPSASERQRAQQFVRELFLDRYQKAATAEEKQAVAQDLFERSKSMGDDLAGEFVMLTTAIKIAIDGDNLQIASPAVERLADRFQYDVFEMKVALLRKSEDSPQTSAFDETVLNDAMQLARDAEQRDDYRVAKEMYDAALAAARRMNDRDRMASLQRSKADMLRIASQFDEMQEMLSRVGDPTGNGVVNEKVGRFYCFAKGNWEKGLPHLVQAEVASLRELAERDQAAGTDPQKQLEVADAWYALAKKLRSPESDHVNRRAKFWYESARSKLPEGLNRLKAELRMQQLDDESRS